MWLEVGRVDGGILLVPIDDEGCGLHDTGVSQDSGMEWFKSGGNRVPKTTRSKGERNWPGAATDRIESRRGKTTVSYAFDERPS